MTGAILGPATGLIVGFTAWGSARQSPAKSSAQQSSALENAIVTAVIVAVMAGLVYGFVAAMGGGSDGMIEPHTLTIRAPRKQNLPGALKLTPGILLPATVAVALLLLRSDAPSSMPAISLWNSPLFAGLAGSTASLTIALPPPPDRPVCGTGSADQSMIARRKAVSSTPARSATVTPRPSAQPPPRPSG